MAWLLPNAYAIPGLAGLSILAYLANGFGYPFWSELLGGRRERLIAKAEIRANSQSLPRRHCRVHPRLRRASEFAWVQPCAMVWLPPGADADVRPWGHFRSRDPALMGTRENPW